LKFAIFFAEVTNSRSMDLAPRERVRCWRTDGRTDWRTWKHIAYAIKKSVAMWSNLPVSFFVKIMI